MGNGVVVGRSSNIQAAQVEILKSIILRGTFTPTYYVEWFGASKSKKDNQIYINSAIDVINQTDNGGTLILSDAYEITDSILLYGKVSIHGTSGYNPSRYKYSQQTSCFIINFNSPDKWVIDIKPKAGEEKIPYNKLGGFVSSEDETLSEYFEKEARFDIKNIRFQYKDGSSIAYGFIRVTDITASVFEGIDMSCGAVVGISLMANVWGLQIRDCFIYADYCGVYMGEAVTYVTINNVNMQQGLPWGGIINVNSNYESEPLVIYSTSIPPYLSGIEKLTSSAFILENASFTSIGCIMQGWDSCIIGTDYNAYFLHPYIEQIKKTIGWLYSTKVYGPDTNRKQLVVNNMVLGMYKVNSYTFGTVRGLIETYNTMCGRYYAPKDESWNYKSYIIHLPPTGTNMGVMYYDDFDIDDEGNASNTFVCPYKELIFSDNNERRIINISNDNKSKVEYLNSVLSYGVVPHYTTFNEFCKRGIYKDHIVRINSNSVIMDSGGYLLDSVNIDFLPLSGTNITLANNPIRIQNSVVKIGSIDKRMRMTKDVDNTINAYFGIQGENQLYFINTAIYNNSNTTNGCALLQLEGDKEIQAEIYIDDLSTFSFSGEEDLKNKTILNPDFSYPYTIRVYKGNNIYTFTNSIAPTKGLSKGFQYFDTTLNKPIWWNGTEWVDALGRLAGDTYNEVRHNINGTEIKVISTDAESQGLSIYAPTELGNDNYVVAQQNDKAVFVDPADIGLK